MPNTEQTPSIHQEHRPLPKNILAIIGSASTNSANQQLVEYIAQQTTDWCQFTIYNDLKTLPHFDPELSVENTPTTITEIRKKIEQADAILFCTPEYVFSIPSGLKNMVEWCVATTVFSDKPVGIITASAHGQKGHEELQMILQTIVTKFVPETTLLIQGIKGKINKEGVITDSQTTAAIAAFIQAFKSLVANNSQ